MANLEIQGKTVELKTRKNYSSDYYAIIHFNTPETENSENCKSAEFRLTGKSRSDMTFDQVEEQINEYFQEYHPKLEISEFMTVKIEEREVIKKRPFENYEF